MCNSTHTTWGPFVSVGAFPSRDGASFFAASAALAASDASAASGPPTASGANQTPVICKRELRVDTPVTDDASRQGAVVRRMCCKVAAWADAGSADFGGGAETLAAGGRAGAAVVGAGDDAPAPGATTAVAVAGDAGAAGTASAGPVGGEIVELSATEAGGELLNEETTIPRTIASAAIPPAAPHRR